ncbi:unnamed protein product [Didymodactylos carnosus]|uniref:FAD-binding PCMH-type domain-containing protein n=1 Tax=Didymodactylos carnosus TaxID=1234261 RepID=A0A814T0Z4_9BILA|nr:unnamed protein product [Didymodactylos carnosus]CAF3918627.1 unnamed protein product [Didymodactylos carnosus]
MNNSYIRLYITFIFLSVYFVINTQSDSLSTLESTIIAHGGQVLRITDPQYKAAATLHNRAIQIWPDLILRPATYDDVSLALSTLSSLQIPIRIMGGRHSYGGYCSHQGIVLDSALLKGLKIDLATETVIMQAGVIWDDVYRALNGSEYVVLGGLCPTVGVVGFALGGGYNAMYSRSFGLASDNVLNFTVVLYNGSVVTASSKTNSDLYWALRGGGGGNFGYVVEMTQKIHRINETKLPNGQFSFLNITWVKADTRTALTNWLTFLKEVGDTDTRISFNVIVIVNGGSDVLMMYCSFNGPHVEIDSVFGLWLSQNPKPTFFNVFNYTQSDISRELGIPFPVVNREHVLSAMAINITDAMLDVILEFQPNSTAEIGSWTELIYLNNANKDKDTAYAFPDISFDIAPGVSWKNPDTDPYAIEMSEKFLQKLIDAAAPTKSIVGAYLNYIDPYLPNWQTMYYRNHWDRLREIQTKWDPTWYFRFPQGIPPYKQQSNAYKLTNKNMVTIGSLIMFCETRLLMIAEVYSEESEPFPGLFIFMDPDKDIEEITMIMNDQVAAWNRGDIDEFMNVYWKSDSLAFINKNGIKYGWKTVLDDYKQRYPNKDMMGKLISGILKIELQSPVSAFLVGKWDLKRKENNDVGGYFTLLWKKIDGKWLITTDHTS